MWQEKWAGAEAEAGGVGGSEKVQRGAVGFGVVKGVGRESGAWAGKEGSRGRRFELLGHASSSGREGKGLLFRDCRFLETAPWLRLQLQLNCSTFFAQTGFI
jgi:hypothetical protein